MNKNLYLLGILFLSLALVAGIFESVILSQVGFAMVYLESFATFYLIFSIVYVVAAMFVVCYFCSKSWRFLYISFLCSAILFLVQTGFQYVMWISVTHDFRQHQMIVAGVYILSGIVGAVGLIFSTPRGSWSFKVFGLITLLHFVILSATLFAIQLGWAHDTIIKVHIWLTFISSFFPAFYIVIFAREMKSLSYESNSSPRQQLINSSGAISVVVLVILLITFGGQLSTESYWNLDWQRRGPQEAKKLAERFESHSYVRREGDTLYYLLMKPLNYDSTKKYPIVTCLHGGPTRIAGNVEVTQPAPLLSEYANREKYPAFLFVPQGRPGVLWGGMLQVPSMDSIVLETMNHLEKQFNIDDKRRYVAGISGGGYGSWHFICSHPDMFAAAIPICGAGDPSLAKLIIDVPVWAFHGTADRNVSVTGSRNMIEAIRSAGGNPKYSEFPGVGHNVWPEVEKTEGVLDWLFAQHR